MHAGNMHSPRSRQTFVIDTHTLMYGDWKEKGCQLRCPPRPLTMVQNYEHLLPVSTFFLSCEFHLTPSEEV
ncbi:hypothetical protein TNCV_158151 [Trichonephila clavipes]|nr:hypothetical protein TNCV_158151 [Trichonephila clavipes]